MRPMTQPKETVQNAEQRLWSQYMLAQSTVNRTCYEYDKAWRDLVMNDDRETVARVQVLSTMWRDARENAESAYRAWKQVAYPLNGLPFKDDTSL
jgi:hypothetical protein